MPKRITRDDPAYGLSVEYEHYTKQLWTIHKVLATIIEIEAMKKDPDFKRLLGNNKVYEADIKTIKQLKEALDSVYKVFMKVKEDFDKSELANLELQNPD